MTISKTSFIALSLIVAFSTQFSITYAKQMSLERMQSKLETIKNYSVELQSQVPPTEDALNIGHWLDKKHAGIRLFKDSWGSTNGEVRGQMDHFTVSGDEISAIVKIIVKYPNDDTRKSIFKALMADEDAEKVLYNAKISLRKEDWGNGKGGPRSRFIDAVMHHLRPRWIREIKGLLSLSEVEKEKIDQKLAGMI